MPTVVVLLPSGEKKAMETTVFEYTPQLVAKLLKKKKMPELIGSYPYGEMVLTLWSWKEGKAGTENKHELPPPYDDLLFGEILVTAGEEAVTPEIWDAFYTEAFGGFEDLEDEEEIDAEIEVEEVEVEEAEVEEAEEVEVEVEENDDLEETDEIDADDDCYDDGDEAGGGSKRRAPRKKTAQSAELRRIDMGLRSKIKLPTIVGKRAPKWQIEDEITEEAYA
jgi:hypothetical protein